MTRGKHWEVEMNCVVYTAYGAESMEKEFKGVDGVTVSERPAEAARGVETQASRAPEPVSEAPDAAGVRMLVVVSIPRQGLVNAVRPPAGSKATVQVGGSLRHDTRHWPLCREPERVVVRDSSKMLPGMELRVRLREGRVWELVGACPRWVGKW